LSIGLLTGKVRINIEARLQINYNKESGLYKETGEYGEEKVIQNIKNLIELAGDFNAFDNMPKYTKMQCEKEKFRGWHLKGNKRYNYLITIVRKGRASNTSKEMEMELKSNYAKICGKHNNRHNIGDGNCSNSDESDD